MDKKALLTSYLLILINSTALASSNNTQPTSNEALTVDDHLRQLLKAAVVSSNSFADRYDAEVWLVAMSKKLKRYIKNPENPV